MNVGAAIGKRAVEVVEGVASETGVMTVIVYRARSLKEVEEPAAAVALVHCCCKAREEDSAAEEHSSSSAVVAREVGMVSS
jgi:hypothetical protein